jgi:hypothetical protein
MRWIEQHATGKLEPLTSLMGFVAITAEDDAFFLTPSALRRTSVETSRPMVTGDTVRDYLTTPDTMCAFPYADDLSTTPLTDIPNIARMLWPNRRVLQRRKRFGTYIEDIPALKWHEFGELYREKLRTPLSIAFAEVATHNHFVLDRGGKVFKQTAPVIKLPEGAAEEEHLRLLGVLNSSTACFWLKQSCFPRGGSGIGRGIQPEHWMERFAFNASNVERFPLPAEYPTDLATELNTLAQRLAGSAPAAVAASGVPTRERLAAAEDAWRAARSRMIALQEELDWQVYRLYGLLDVDLTAPAGSIPDDFALGERAFEIVLASSGEQTEWFKRHGSQPRTTLPGDWSPEYASVVQRRIEAIAADRNIALIERPECKRRWSTPGWETLRKAALRDWLLDRLEAPALWGGAPTPLSVAQLADRIRHDGDVRAALDLWIGSDQHDPVATLGALVADEHVPFLPAHRYKPSGLRKRAQWERTWALQRREDAGEKVEIPVPPKYASADFARPGFWRNRGKLDVPKERFVSYPGLGRDGDPSELLGWAGWDHLAQAQALAGVYLDRRNQAAWPAGRLLPLLAGIVELEPWLRQWHAGPRPGFPGSPAEFFADLVDTERLARRRPGRPLQAPRRGPAVTSTITANLKSSFS